MPSTTTTQSHFDQAFRSHHPERFETSFQKSGGTSLLINGSSTSDPSSVLPVWADHFSNLGTSHLSTNPSLQEISNTIPEVEIATLVEEERILDVSFLPKEVDAALNTSHVAALQVPTLSPHSTSFMLARFSSPGLAKFSMLLYMNLEAIPSQFKMGIIVPIYKGKGKDPLLPRSYSYCQNF